MVKAIRPAGASVPLAAKGSKARSNAGRVFVSRILRTRGAGFGLAMTTLVVALALVAPIVSPYDPLEQDITAILQSPSRQHWMGTDQLGRDNFSRIIYGSRVSIQAGLVSVGFAIVVGTLIGLVAGYFRGWVDDSLMRLADALWSFPALVLALAIAAALGQGLSSVMLAIGIVLTPVFARLVRSSTLSVRERDYVTAALVLGAGNPRIMWFHVLPNVFGPVIVQASLAVAGAIITEASLSFLGLGVQPPTPSWGSMLRTAYQYMQTNPWPSIFPGAAIFLTVLGINLLGDGVRRALDPRLRGRGEA